MPYFDPTLPFDLDGVWASLRAGPRVSAGTLVSDF